MFPFILKKNEVFLIQIDQDPTSDWIGIEFPLNRFSTYSNKSEKKFSVGFVQKSMIKRVKDLERYDPDDLVLNFQIVKAVEIPANRWVYGLEPLLEISYSVSKMTLEWKNGKSNLGPVLFDDLFNINFFEGLYSSRLNDKFSFYRNDNVVFVQQACGDGAGSYEVTWVISHGVVMQRIIDEM